MDLLIVTVGLQHNKDTNAHILPDTRSLKKNSHVVFTLFSGFAQWGQSNTLEPVAMFTLDVRVSTNKKVIIKNSSTRMQTCIVSAVRTKISCCFSIELFQFSAPAM